MDHEKQPGAAEEFAGEFTGEFGTQTDEADRDAKAQIAKLKAQRINDNPHVQKAREHEDAAQQKLLEAESLVIRMGKNILSAESEVARTERLHNQKRTPSTLEALQQAEVKLRNAKTAKENAIAAMQQAAEELRKATEERESAENEAVSLVVLDKGMKAMEAMEDRSLDR
ncbi:hypothetical protein HYW83_01965 [Candidatus Peregrinibacteria bacterium]|nr:hypothetical protein [Candidatus Peregrinibacteria bacterium]